MNTTTKLLALVFVLFFIGAYIYLNGFAAMMNGVHF